MHDRDAHFTGCSASSAFLQFRLIVLLTKFTAQRAIVVDVRQAAIPLNARQLQWRHSRDLLYVYCYNT